MGEQRGSLLRCRNAWHASKGWIAAGSLIVITVLVAVTVIQAYAVRRTYTTVNWGSVAEGIGAAVGLIAAVGTVAAVWVAVIGWRSEVKHRRDEESDRNEERRRSQAELIGAWVDTVSHEMAIMTVGIINASEGVVYDLLVHVDLETEIAQDPRVRRHPDVTIGPFPARAHVPVVPPGHWQVTFRIAGTQDPLVATVLDVYFRDQRQLSWTRDIKGQLDHADRPIFDIPKMSEKTARELDYKRMLRSDYIMVHTPELVRTR